MAANYIKAFRSFFRFLCEQGLWNVDPTLRLKLPKHAYRERYVPSEQQVFTLLSQPLELRDRIFLVLCVNCALRRAEFN
jgi:site-specific recombinase XerD